MLGVVIAGIILKALNQLKSPLKDILEALYTSGN